MSSLEGLFDDLTAGAASLNEAATTLALIAGEMAQGFTSQQVFDLGALRVAATKRTAFWVNSPASGAGYGVLLDQNLLTETSAEGVLMGLRRMDIPPENRKRVTLTNDGGCIRFRVQL